MSHLLLTASRPLVMGIVNVTPDSFSDGGLHFSKDAALAHALQLLDEGADILDIGGESTRPNAEPVSEQQELDRVMPILEGLRGVPVPLSIDTWKTTVMRAAIAAGATFVNDVNALQDVGALEVVANSTAHVCMMHKQGTPQTMQQQPRYDHVLDEVSDFLRQRIHAAEGVGIPRRRILIDPGFGFGKTLDHNLTLLRHLSHFAQLGVPLLAGLSRKSMLGAITGQDEHHRLAASLAAALIAAQQGAAILRVHDVRATVDALKVWEAVKGENTDE
ncbi:MAG: dihydropteroate synthase [Gallionella sp.]|nr:dihydropteroate synthase [Gallionella sp.]